jgi:cysteine desulfurase
MYANNEVGTINPIADIAAVAAKHGVPLHSDAVQGIGQLPSDMEMLGVDLASLTAHKIYGPKGIGALYVRRNRSKPHSLFHGGGQEDGVRPGTLNIAGIVGLGAACALAKNYMDTRKSCVATLRDALHQKLNARLEDIHLNGHPEQRLPGNLNLCFAGVQSHALLMGLKSVAVSTGSACDSESVKASHVLVAMGVPNELALTAVRFGLGRYNTAEEIDVVAGEVVRIVNRLRELAPEW